MGQPMTDTEALLWSLGRNPNLTSTMGIVAVLESAPDPERFRATMANTVAGVSRLQQRVEDPATFRPPILDAASVARPEWVTDHNLDFDHHVRINQLLPIGSTPPGADELRRAAAQFINDPFDRARPLWQFQLVTGLQDNRAAVIGKVHHSISDGIGLLKLAASLLEFEPNAAPPHHIDLEQFLAEQNDHHSNEHSNGDGGGEEAEVEVERAERAEAGHDHTSPGGPERLKSWIQEATRHVPSPGEVLGAGVGVVNTARTLSDQLPKRKASDLWATRSRNRRLEFLSISLPSLKSRSEALDATINDIFVAACAEAAVRYHRHHGHPLPSISATIVISTSPPTDAATTTTTGGQLGQGDNSFIPVAITVPGDGATAMDRLRLIQEEVRRRRAAIGERRNLAGTISALGGMIPSSIAASLALDQAAKVDFATSNIPGPPLPTWMAGTSVSEIYPVGPVAGTAFNVTLMTYDQRVCLGVHLDPAAVTDGDVLLTSLRDGFGDFDVSRH